MAILKDGLLTDSHIRKAPGWPGIPPRWTSSAKSGVGTALNLHSRVWFTTSHGILDEIYFPRVDQACTRDFGLLVSDGISFFSEEKRNATSTISHLAGSVPAYRLINICNQGRYRIEKEILTDSHRNVVLQKIRFQPLQGKLADYHVYALLAPHLANCGAGNTGWAGNYKSHRMLFAEREGHALALASSTPWKNMSVGFVGFSDGWQDISKHFQMTWNYELAEDGNIALTGEIDLQACDGEFVLALGFGHLWAEAGQHALSSILDGFAHAKADYLRGWEHWQKNILPVDDDSDRSSLYRTSAAVLRTHESKDFVGG